MVAIHGHAEAWTEFWQEQPFASPCCANDAGIRVRLERHWQELARSLPPGVSALDLGCGTGAVGRALIAANPMMRVTGVDFAAVPASGDGRIEIVPHSCMERLPFGDARFDAAVSQFGFEYANVADASRELARVLRPGAPISFLVHHSEASIARDSIPHRQALEELSGSALGAAFLSGNPAALARQLSQLRRRYPYERIVEQAGQGLLRHIGLPGPQREQIWQGVRQALAPELIMLARLEACSVPPGGMRSWLEPLEEAFELQSPTVLPMPGGKPLCWRIEGMRRPAH